MTIPQEAPEILGIDVIPLAVSNFPKNKLNLPGENVFTGAVTVRGLPVLIPMPCAEQCFEIFNHDIPFTGLSAGGVGCRA